MPSVRGGNALKVLKGRRVHEVGVWEKRFPGGEDSQCKGPEAGTTSSLGEQWEACVPDASEQGEKE